LRLAAVIESFPKTRWTTVDGTALAAEREYLKDSLPEALAAFRRSRRRLCSRLKSTTASERKRCGLRDGARRMNVEDLAREAFEHDETHALELDELRTELLRRRRSDAQSHSDA